MNRRSFIASAIAGLAAMRVAPSMSKEPTIPLSQTVSTCNKHMRVTMSFTQPDSGVVLHGVKYKVVRLPVSR